MSEPAREAQIESAVPLSHAENGACIRSPRGSGDTSDSDSFIVPPKVDVNAPPAYDSIADSALPTYEEVERQKLIEVENTGDRNARMRMENEEYGFHPIFPVDGETLDQDSRLGTDFIFFAAFFAAFLLNWIGFLLLLCFCTTVAGRYGALAGFGLSLAKWTVIIKHTMLTRAARFFPGGKDSGGTPAATSDASDEESWLWWLPLGFGMLICLHAIFQYIHIKRQWHLMSRSCRQRLLLFY